MNKLQKTPYILRINDDIIKEQEACGFIKRVNDSFTLKLVLIITIGCPTGVPSFSGWYYIKVMHLHDEIHFALVAYAGNHQVELYTPYSDIFMGISWISAKLRLRNLTLAFFWESKAQTVFQQYALAHYNHCSLTKVYSYRPSVLER